MKSLLTIVRRAQDGLTCLMLVALLAVLLLGVFCRYVLGSALYWSDMLSVNIFTWMVLLGIPICFREGTMFRVDMLLTRWSAKSRLVWEKFVHVLELVVLGVTLWYGIEITQSQWGMLLLAFPEYFPTVNFGWIYIAIPISCALAMIEVLIRLFSSRESIAGQQVQD